MSYQIYENMQYELHYHYLDNASSLYVLYPSLKKICLGYVDISVYPTARHRIREAEMDLQSVRPQRRRSYYKGKQDPNIEAQQSLLWSLGFPLAHINRAQPFILMIQRCRVFYNLGEITLKFNLIEKQIRVLNISKKI